MFVDLDIACGRQRSTPQTDRGQGDMTPMTLNHCNVQIGSSNHMTVNQSGDNDSDMSSLEAGDRSPDANVSASLSENVPVGRREQLDTSPDVRSVQLDTSADVRSGQLNTSPEVRPGQPNIGPEVRSRQRDIGIVQGQHSLSDEPDVPPYGSVVPSDSADTDVKVLSVATPEPTMDETVSVHEDLSVEVSMTPTWDERDLESQQLRENEGSSDEDTSLLKPCRSIETHASPDGGGSYASCYTGGSTVSDLERDVHDRFSDSAEDSGHASVWPATAGVSLDHHGRESSPKQTSGDIKGKIRPSTELLDGMVSGTFSDLCVHNPSNVQESNDQSGVSVHSDVNLVQGKTDHSDVSLVQGNTDRSDVSLVQTNPADSDVSFVQGKTDRSDVNRVQGNTAHSDVSHVQGNTDRSDVSLVQGNTDRSDVSLDQQGAEQNRENSYDSSRLLFFTVAAVVALTAVIFLMKK